MNPAGTGWRESQNLVTAVGRPNRFTQFGLIILEIAREQNSVIRLHPIAGCLRKGSAIKPVQTPFSNRAISVGEVRLFQEVARLESRAIGSQKNRAGSRELP